VRHFSRFFEKWPTQPPADLYRRHFPLHHTHRQPLGCLRECKPFLLRIDVRDDEADKPNKIGIYGGNRD
jgi:hypothetical protein